MSFDFYIKNGDFVIQNGDLVQVQDTNKLAQDLLKICLTEAGANPMQPWYGSYVSRSIIGSPLATSVILQVGQSQLQTAIENLKNLQAAQVKSFQQMTPEEQISSILDISINRSVKDFRAFMVKVKVLSKALKPISTTFDITL